MKNLCKKQIISSLLIFNLVAVPFSNIPHVFAEEGIQQENLAYLKVSTSSGVILYHQKVTKNQLVQMLNAYDEVIDSQVFNNDLALVVPEIDVPEDKVLSYWTVAQEEGIVTIKPVLVPAQQGTIKFSVDGDGGIIKDNASIKELSVSFKKGETIESYLPEVKPSENIKFGGWYVDDKKIDTKKYKLENDVNVIGKFYSDINNNDIDDKTESATVKFNTNSDIKIADLTIFIGDYIELPILKRDNQVFLGWFSDGEFKNKFDNNKPIKENVTLFAKWEKAEKLIDDSQNKKLTDPLVTKQLEEILKNLNNLNSVVKGKAESIPPKVNPSATVPPQTSLKPQTQTPTKPVQPPQQPQIIQPQVPNAEKEVRYVFSNPNVGQKYMVKFYDENNNYLFSVLSPYGQTIRLYNLDKIKLREYGVRQNTSITLDSKDFYFENNPKAEYFTKDTTINDHSILDVFPSMPKNSDILKKNNKKVDTLANHTPKKDTKWLYLLWAGIILIALSVIGIILYIIKPNFLKKRTKK